MKSLIYVGIAAFSMGSMAFAATFQNGDVFAAIGSGEVQWWRGSTLVSTLNTTRGGFTTGMAFDSAGNLYVTSFSDGSVARFNTDGTLANATFVSGISSSPESIVFDASGNFYVGSADGSRDVHKYSAAGAHLASYDVATEDRGSDWIDLSPDGNTLYYTSEGYKVKTFDLVGNAQGADFATLSDRAAFAMRLLPGGGALVADSINIKRLDAAGATIQTYDVASLDGWFALNLDPDGTSFWSGSSANGTFYQFDIATGSQLFSQATGSGSHFGLSVFGEITVVNPPSVPDGGGILRLMFIAVPALLGFRRVRR